MSTAQAEPMTTESLFDEALNTGTYTLVVGEDRCDRCGAEAFVATEITDPATSKTHLLLWCAHHAREHANKIQSNPNMRIVADRTKTLFAAPKPTM